MVNLGSALEGWGKKLAFPAKGDRLRGDKRGRRKIIKTIKGDGR